MVQMTPRPRIYTCEDVLAVYRATASVLSHYGKISLRMAFEAEWEALVPDYDTKAGDQSCLFGAAVVLQRKHIGGLIEEMGRWAEILVRSLSSASESAPQSRILQLTLERVTFELAAMALALGAVHHAATAQDVVYRRNFAICQIVEVAMAEWQEAHDRSFRKKIRLTQSGTCPRKIHPSCKPENACGSGAPRSARYGPFAQPATRSRRR